MHPWDRSRFTAIAIASALAAGATAQETPLELQVRQTLEKARPALREHLSGHGAGPLLLTALAALHDEFPQDDPDFLGAIERLVEFKLVGTYELALRLMILSEADWIPNRERVAKADLKQLQRNWTGGGFTYPTNRGGQQKGDLSNTQYGALGLRAAASMGLPVRDRIWQALAKSVAAQQNRDGGFTYSGGGGGMMGSYASMTVAGIGVLEVCRQALQGEGGKRGAASAAKFDAPLAAAWRWMDGNQRAIGSLDERNCFYFHYGLERAGILSEVTEVGGVDWYRRGAEMFIGAQLEGGGWRSAHGFGAFLPPVPGAAVDKEAGTPVDTAFAVLFLRRKFQRVLGPVTGVQQGGILALGPRATTDEIKAAAKLAVAQGSAGMTATLEAMASDERCHRIAAAYALIGLCDDDFGFNPHRPAEHNREPIAAAKAWLVAHPYK